MSIEIPYFVDMIISEKQNVIENERPKTTQTSASNASTTVSSTSRETSSISTMTSMSEEKTTTSYKLSQQWSWWNPANRDNDIDPVTTDTDDTTENVDAAAPPSSVLWENVQTMTNSFDAAAINNDTIDQVKDIDYTKTVSNRDNRNNEASEDDTDNKHEEIDDWEISSETFLGQKENGVDHETLRDKYLELMAHNTKLVDILRKTLEMQADMFRRLIRYLFP